MIWANDDQSMAYRSVALCMTWHRQTSHTGWWETGGLVCIYIWFDDECCSSGKPLVNWGWGMFGGPRLVENRWSALTMCIRCPRMVEKAVEALRFVSLIDLSCQESSSWKSKFLMRAIRFWLYIYMATYIMVYMLSRINTFTCEMFSTLYIYYGIEENFTYESIFGCHKIKLAHLVCACIVWCGTSLW